MTQRFIGMISGTSRDGADIGLVSFSDNRPTLEHTLCLPYPDHLADQLRQLIVPARRPDNSELSGLHDELGRFFAEGANRLLGEAGLEPGDITAIGSHGQTVWHEPPESIQLGNPALIASITNITTVGDFRSADLEAGGEGAPLAPLLHRALFQPDSGQTAVINLGGIANISLVTSDGQVSGYDTGPANCLMDGWIQRHRQQEFDDCGAWAASGAVIRPLLITLLEDPWFSRLPPKSTGVEYFNMHWLESKADLGAFQPQDIQATLAELTAQSVADAVPDDTTEVLVCGGGAHNSHVLNRLRAIRPDITLHSTATHGVNPDAVEATLFAWLARERLAERTLDTTSITGARQPVLLGSVYHP